MFSCLCQNDPGRESSRELQGCSPLPTEVLTLKNVTQSDELTTWMESDELTAWVMNSQDDTWAALHSQLWQSLLFVLPTAVGGGDFWGMCNCRCCLLIARGVFCGNALFHLSPGVWWWQIHLPGHGADEGGGAARPDPEAEILLRAGGQCCALHHRQDRGLPALPGGEWALLPRSRLTDLKLPLPCPVCFAWIVLLLQGFVFYHKGE